jgi:hypothetical protein
VPPTAGFRVSWTFLSDTGFEKDTEMVASDATFCAPATGDEDVRYRGAT